MTSLSLFFQERSEANKGAVQRNEQAKGILDTHSNNQRLEERPQLPDQESYLLDHRVQQLGPKFPVLAYLDKKEF